MAPWPDHANGASLLAPGRPQLLVLSQLDAYGLGANVKHSDQKSFEKQLDRLIAEAETADINERKQRAAKMKPRLGELGLDASDPIVAKAVEEYVAGRINLNELAEAFFEKIDWSKFS
jgi:hypothetical protein